MTKQLLWTVLILCMSYSGAVTYAYDGDNHQQLTFIAVSYTHLTLQTIYSV